MAKITSYISEDDYKQALYEHEKYLRILNEESLSNQSEIYFDRYALRDNERRLFWNPLSGMKQSNSVKIFDSKWKIHFAEVEDNRAPIARYGAPKKLTIAVLSRIDNDPDWMYLNIRTNQMEPVLLPLTLVHTGTMFMYPTYPGSSDPFGEHLKKIKFKPFMDYLDAIAKIEVERLNKLDYYKTYYYFYSFISNDLKWAYLPKEICDSVLMVQFGSLINAFKNESDTNRKLRTKLLGNIAKARTIIEAYDSNKTLDSLILEKREKKEELSNTKKVVKLQKEFRNFAQLVLKLGEIKEATALLEAEICKDEPRLQYGQFDHRVRELDNAILMISRFIKKS